MMNEKTCPECGTRQDVIAKYCKNCGAPLSSEDDINDSKVCPKCGANQNDGAKFCRECGHPLDIEDKHDDGTIKCKHCGCELTNEQYCPDCGKETGIKTCPKCRQKSVNENYCPTCGYRLNQNVKTCSHCGSQIDANAQVCASCGARVLHKSPIIALALSLIFPGLGQFYNTQNHKGITLFIAYIVSWILSLILIGFVLALLIWVYGMYDAYSSANAINSGEQLEDRIFQ